MVAMVEEERDSIGSGCDVVVAGITFKLKRKGNFVQSKNEAGPEALTKRMSSTRGFLEI